MRRLIIAITGLATLAAAVFTAPAATAAAQDLETSVYSGIVAPGGTQHRWWNNANPLSVSYTVGLSPRGASISASCQFEVVSEWYQQNLGGEREYHYIIKNVGTISCGTDIHLYSLDDIAGFWNTGALSPGQTTSKHWNNANPHNLAYVPGLSPNGATTSGPCKMEITRTWYVEQPGGEREFWFDVKNTGTVACVADVLLGSRSTVTMFGTGTKVPGQSTTVPHNNANPLAAAYVVGFAPDGATLTTPCKFQLTRSWYLQRINADGSVEREFHQTYQNIGSITCSAVRLLATA
ncbi:hypothetical protein GCM10023148_01590 [Actinokineospora soli]